MINLGLDAVLGFIGGALVSTFALLAMLAAGAVYLGQIVGRIPSLLASPLIAICVAAGVGLYAYDAGGDAAQVKSRIAGLERSLEAAQAVAAMERERAIAAAAASAEREKIIDGYEAELAAGQANACPADDAYTRRMRGISIGRDAP